MGKLILIPSIITGAYFPQSSKGDMNDGKIFNKHSLYVRSSETAN